LTKIQGRNKEVENFFERGDEMQAIQKKKKVYTAKNPKR